MKLTKWFRPEIKPVRPGWYETKGEYFVKTPSMCYWSGDTWYWRTSSFHPNGVAAYDCLDQNRHWRGLTKPAE